MKTTCERIKEAMILGLMASVTGLAVNLMLETPLTGLLLLSSGLAWAATLPATFRRLGLTLSPVLAFVGLYVLWRIGFGEQVGSIAQTLKTGLAAYRHDIVPLTVQEAPELQCLITTVWYVIALVATWFSNALKRPLIGSAILAGAMGTFVTMQPHHRGLPLVAAFLVLLGALLAASKNRVPSSTKLQRLLLGAAGTAMGLAAAWFLLALSPSIVKPGLPAVMAWDPLRRGPECQLVYDWRRNYPTLLDPAQDFPVMRVITQAPSYWRANTLEVFTGDSWISNGSFPISLGQRASRRGIPAQETAPPGKDVEETFEILSMKTAYLFAGGYPRDLFLYDPTEVFLSGSMTLKTAVTLGPRFTYRVAVTLPQVKPEDLVGRGRDYPEEIRRTYLQLPFSKDPVPKDDMLYYSIQWDREFRGIYLLSEKIVGEATDPYEIALRIERYLRNNYSYSLDLPQSEQRSAYAAFLFDWHKGYCQHFAGAAALLLRVNGIPARVAVGFVTGENVGPQTYEVSINDAHSWVEVYFPGTGWVAFEPTPGRFLPSPGASAYSAGFHDPFAAQALQDENMGPTGEPSGRRQQPDEGLFPVAFPTTQLPKSSSRAWIAALPLLVLIMIPACIRLSVFIFSHFGPYERRLRMLGHQLLAEVRAFGIPVSRALTWEEVGQLVNRRLGQDLGPAIYRMERVCFGKYEATSEDVSLWQDAVRRVRRELRMTRGWLRTLIALYDVRYLRS